MIVVSCRFLGTIWTGLLIASCMAACGAEPASPGEGGDGADTGGDTTPAVTPGVAGGPCYPNDSCNAGLACTGGICADPGAAAGVVGGIEDVVAAPEDTDDKRVNKEPAPQTLVCDDGTTVLIWQYGYDAVCDRWVECPDGSDEKDCNFECADGNILPTGGCDGAVQCADGADEADCPVACPGEPGLMLATGRCDGVAVCARGGDEARCPFTCSDGTTLASGRCDGQRDCSDGGEEANCPFTCSDGTSLASGRCDGISACSQGEDEAGCSAEPPKQREEGCNAAGGIPTLPEALLLALALRVRRSSSRRRCKA
jgi:uncharacterized protein (TIGR03382 family)